MITFSLLDCLQAVRKDFSDRKIFKKQNLVAWCVVPFDGKQRGPVERAQMLNRLGITKLAYDYRKKHIPTFDAEVKACKKHNIELFAWWFPQTLNDEAKHILKVLKQNNVQTQLWVMGRGEPKSNKQSDQHAWIQKEVKRLRPIAQAALKINCKVGLYNHLGWFGEPENQIAIIKELNMPNVGIVYNFHHGHAHMPRMREILAKLKPYLYAININGMTDKSVTKENKIMPLAAGELDHIMIRVIAASGYDGPIGILNHTNHDAEVRLKENLHGLKWLVSGKEDSEKPDYPTLQSPQN